LTLKKTEIENLEIELLIEAIFKRYGYDFRYYSRASIKRRLKHFLSKTNLNRIAELIPRVIHDKPFFDSLFFTISITVTEMFRDPFVYQTIRKKIIPFLKTYPFIKIWNSGCATGEEVYSMAILLKEEGLSERSQIYATDFNDLVLKKVKEGIYPIENIKQYTANYQKSGGKESFSNYYHSKYDSAIMNRELAKNITFANHNLTSDTVFGEMHLIMCRNVLIYFDKPLQDRALKLFHDSLASRGFLCLGTKESLQFSKVSKRFVIMARKEKIYQKR